MAITPEHGIEDTLVQFSVKINGNELNETYGIQSVYVHHAINKISVAKLVFTAEVETDSGNIQFADSDVFTPGNTLQIFAGYAGKATASIFKGLIVKHTVKLDAESPYTFTIVCKHEAVKMTYNATERYFEKQTDDAVIRNIIGEYGISCAVSHCSETNESMFQKMSTDWDFILSRSDFNGFIVTLDDDSGVVIAAPKLSGDAVLTIEAGNSLISFEGSLDAGFQPPEVHTSAWDAKTLTLLKASASEPAVNDQGDLKAKNLSSKLSQSPLNLTSVTPMTSEALKTWADGILLRKRLHAFKGEVQYLGNALAKTGSIIEIKGVGNKLSGQAFVSAVTHRIEQGNWNTSVSFGLDNDQIHESTGFSYPPAMGHLPAMQGLQLGIVKKIDQDPGNLFRIQVEIPSGSTTPNTTWARMANDHASDNSGFFFLPEINDEVILGFLDNDTRYPVILGSLYNGKHGAPYMPEAGNNTKAIVTRSKMKIVFDEKKKNISLLTPNNNSIIISDDGRSIEIKDQNSNCIQLSADGIAIDSVKDITISARGNIDISAAAKVTLAAQSGDVDLSGLNINATAAVGLTAKGNATAEISAAGQTTVKGAIVMIN